MKRLNFTHINPLISFSDRFTQISVVGIIIHSCGVKAVNSHSRISRFFIKFFLKSATPTSDFKNTSVCLFASLVNYSFIVLACILMESCQNLLYVFIF
jgi:hypothetical protein